MLNKPSEHYAYVTLVTTANPPVTVDPEKIHISKGKSKIKWQPADGQKDDWAFEWIRKPPDKTNDLDDPPFKTTVENQEIEVEADNENGKDVDYDYAISVTKDGTSYNTDPRIVFHG